MVLAVIDPAKQRLRSKHGVMQGNLAKVCQAMIACKSSNVSFNSAGCDSFTEIGATQPTLPTGATYRITRGGTSTAATGYNWADAYMESGTANFSSSCALS